MSKFNLGKQLLNDIEAHGSPYKILQRLPSDDTPIVLDAVLAEKYDAKNPMPSMDYPWRRMKSGIKAPFPEQIFLISNYDDLLRFDFYPKFSGFIISEALKDKLVEQAAFDEASIDDYCQIVPIKSVNISGRRNTVKRYFFLRFINTFPIIDYDASEFVLKRGANKRLVKRGGYGIAGFDKIVLNGLDHKKSFFRTADVMFLQGIVVTNALADILKDMGLVGFKISTIEAYALDYRKKHDFNYIDPEKLERNRAKRNRKK